MNQIEPLHFLEEIYLQGKKRARKFTRVRKACILCARAHLSCGIERPCNRCIQKGIGDKCQDNPSEKKRGRKKIYSLENKEENEQQNKYILSSNRFIAINPFAKTPKNNIFCTNMDLATELQSILTDLLGYVPQLDSSDEEDDEQYGIIRDYIRMRLRNIHSEEEIDEFVKNINQVGDYVTQHCEIHKKSCSEMFRVINVDQMNQIIEEQKILSKNGIPIIIWDRNSIIHYVSDGFKQLTNFDFQTPTNPFLYPVYEEFSAFGFEQLIIAFSNFMLSSVNGTQCSSDFMIKTGIRRFPEFVYIDGTMHISVIFDENYLPFIWIGTFLPTNLPQKEFLAFNF